MSLLKSIPKGDSGEPITDIGLLYLMASSGEVDGLSVVHKFGAGSVTATLAPISQLNKYSTPITATSLEVVSDNAADASGGAGALKVTIVGLDENWEEVSQEITLNGLTPVALTTDLVRMYRWFVSESGTYSNGAAGSHVGSLTVQESGGGTPWDTIPVSPFPAGQSQIGSFTIPKGKTGYLIGKLVFTDTSKVADVFMFRRNNADDVTAPYKGIMRIIEREIGVQGGYDHHFAAPKNGFVGPCDIGFMAKVASGTASMSIEFEMLLVDN